MAGTEVGVGYVRLVPSMQGFGPAAAAGLAGPVNQAGRTASTSFATGLASAGAGLNRAGSAVTTKVGLPILGVGLAALTMGGNFEAGMNRVRAISGASEADMAAMRDQAKDLGATTMFSATQAADALGFLSMAGFDAEQAMGALPGVLDLAAAGELELGEAADYASNILTGFGLEVEDLGHLNDVLVNTANNANTDVRMLADAFKYAGPVAAQAGLSIEETSAAIGLLGNAGFQGEMGGTALRGALAQLLDPAGKAATTLNDLGAETHDAQGNMLPLVDIIGQIEGSSATAADMMDVFGMRAGPGMLSLIEQGSGALEEMTEVTGRSGTAAESAAIRMEGLKGGTTELMSAFEGLMIAIAESGLLDFATQMVKELTKFTQSLSETNPEILKFGTLVGAGLIVLGPLMKVLGSGITGAVKFGRGVASMAKGVASIAKFAGRGAMALGRLGQAATKAAAKVVAAGARMVASAVRTAARVVAQIAVQIAKWVLLGVQSLLHAAKVAMAWLISLGPLGLLIAAVIAAVALVIANWDRISAFFSQWAPWLWGKVTGVFTAVKDFVFARISDIVGLFSNIPGWIVSYIVWVLTKYIEIFTLVKDFVLARIDDIVGFFSGLPARIWGFLVDVYDKHVEIMDDVAGWVGDRVDDVVGFFADLPGKIKSAFSGLTDIIKGPFTAAFDAIKSFWNNNIAGFGFTVPDWIPGVGGKGFTIPRMHSGGIFDSGGSGSEGLAVLRSGEGVFTRGQMAAIGAGLSTAPAAQVVELRVTGTDRELTRLIRRMVDAKGGGSVQVAFGQHR